MNYVESNAVMKRKVRSLQQTIIDSVFPANIIGFLFQEGVISARNMRSLWMIRGGPEQCRSLLSLLHVSHHPRAFIELYHAISEERHLKWLVDRIDSTGSIPHLNTCFRE